MSNINHIKEIRLVLLEKIKFHMHQPNIKTIQFHEISWETLAKNIQDVKVFAIWNSESFKTF